DVRPLARNRVHLRQIDPLRDVDEGHIAVGCGERPAELFEVAHRGAHARLRVSAQAGDQTVCEQTHRSHNDDVHDGVSSGPRTKSPYEDEGTSLTIPTAWPLSVVDLLPRSIVTAALFPVKDVEGPRTPPRKPSD